MTNGIGEGGVFLSRLPKSVITRYVLAGGFDAATRYFHRCDQIPPDSRGHEHHVRREICTLQLESYLMAIRKRCVKINTS